LDEATTKQFLEVIHRQAQRIGALVRDLLTLSELEARPPEQTKREPVDLAAVAANVRQTVRERAGALKGDVTIEVPAGLRGLGDSDALEQVLENLVDNAIKYGRQGGVVRVVGEKENGRIVVSMGGRISVESEPGKGSRFRVELPPSV
jgi:two-component system phosphate regulon sensor histidine kinase PhoR